MFKNGTRKDDSTHIVDVSINKASCGEILAETFKASPLDLKTVTCEECKKAYEKQISKTR
jgi:hypothetical protein